MGPPLPWHKYVYYHLLLGGGGAKALRPLPLSQQRRYSAKDRTSWANHPTPLGPPPLACLSPSSLPPGYSSGGRTGLRPLSATPSRPTCTPPRAPTPAAPPQSSCKRRALGAGVRSGPSRGGSPALPRSTSPRPARGSRSWTEGGEGTGEELPLAAAPPPPLPPPPPPPRPPHLPRPTSPLALSPPSRPTPGTSPPSAPPTALPPNFPPRWRPRSWTAALPRDRFPGALSQWEVRRRLAPSPGLSALLPLGWKGEEGREGAGERERGPGEHPKWTSSLKGAATEVALKTKELTHRLYRWSVVALKSPPLPRPSPPVCPAVQSE